MLVGRNDALTASERYVDAVPEIQLRVPVHRNYASVGGLFKDISRCVQELWAATFNGGTTPFL
jgi:hypothetical protein